MQNGSLYCYCVLTALYSKVESQFRNGDSDFGNFKLTNK